MKTLLLAFLLLNSVVAFSADKVAIAIGAAIGSELTNTDVESIGYVGVITTIGNVAMVVQKPLKYLFGNNVRDYEVMYKVSLKSGDVTQSCLALVKGKTNSADKFKVLISHCGQAGEIAMLVSGEDKGPIFTKVVIFEADEVLKVRNLNPGEAYSDNN